MLPTVRPLRDWSYPLLMALIGVFYSDPNWWKGSTAKEEGLFPANFVTADLTTEPEASRSFYF